MNRAQRRAARKAQPRYVRGLTQEQVKAKLFKNGITVDDLDKAQEDGFSQGYRAGGREAIRAIYAAVIYQLSKRRWKPETVIDFMRAMDNRVMYSLNSAEDIDEVYRETGIQLDFNDPFSRIQEAGE